MVQDVRYCKTLELVNHLCLNPNIYIVNHSTHYQSASKMQRIQGGNGQYVSVLFIISLITNVCGHRFEVYTLVSKMHENIDIVLGIKNVFGLEGVINS